MEEKLIQQMYSDIGSPHAYSGIETIYKGLRDKGYKIAKSKVRKVLQSIPAYTIHKPSRKHFDRRPMMSSRPGLYLNCDLLEYSTLSADNNNIKYNLVCQDMYSRYVYSELIPNKRGETVAEAMEKILKRSPHSYKFLLCDENCSIFIREI